MTQKIAKALTKTTVSSSAQLNTPLLPGELRMKAVDEAQRRVKAAYADTLPTKRTKKRKGR